MWEYKIVWLPTDGDGGLQNRETLDDAGSDGWELVSVVCDGPVHIAYLKRPGPALKRFVKYK